MSRVAEFTERWLKVFSSALLVAMVFVILSQIAFRYAINVSLAWTEEIGRYLFVWICLFGAALGFRLAQHSGYESVVSAMPASVQRWLMTAVDLLVGLFSIVLVVSSIDLIDAGFGQLTPATQFRIAYVYFAFPLSAIATLIFVADSIRARFRPAPAVL